jgi:small-conductance mechanosensitive channel
MAKAAQALEDALRYTLTETNLPTAFPDFQALTRELIRQLSPHAVLVERETYNELTKRDAQVSKSLEETTARYRAHNDEIEKRMRERGSVPPVPFTIIQLTALGNPRR